MSAIGSRREAVLLSIEQTADLLGLGRSTLYRAVDRGDVPFPVIRIGAYRYVPRAAVERLIEAEPSRGDRTDLRGGIPRGGSRIDGVAVRHRRPCRAVGPRDD